MPAEEAGKEAEDVSESTQTRTGFQGQGRTYGAARRRDGGGTGRPFRGSSAPDLRLEEGADGCGAQGLCRSSGPDRRAQRAHELYEQVGRLMVERDFLLRRSAL